MAVVSVGADFARWDNMDATTNISGIGGGAGAGAEPDIVYQGSNSISRKVTAAGFYTDTGANRDMTAAGRTTWIVKTWLTNYGSLTTTGNEHVVRVGSGTGAYYEYDMGNPTTPYLAGEAGGWVITAIDPSIASHRDGTTGSPTLTACAYFAAYSVCSTSKAENLCLDAIDAGVGLYLTGGDGGDTDGVFDDFAVDDVDDTTNGRIGFVQRVDGGLKVLGRLIIGATSSAGTRTTTATGFTDSDVVVTFPDQFAAAGFSGMTIDLGNASTTVDLTGISFISTGTSAGEDTRAVFEVFGTSGTLTVTGGSILNFAELTLTSACTVSGTTISVETMTQASADVSDLQITTLSASASATLGDPTFGSTTDLHDVTFIQGGSGHALEITSAGSYTLTNIGFSGYGATTSNSAAIYVSASSGTVTLNISGGDSPTYRTAGATVDIVLNPVTTTITARDASDNSVISGARVYLIAADGTGDLPYQESVTITSSGTTATVSHTGHGLTVNDVVLIRGANEADYNGTWPIASVPTANSYTYTMNNSTTSPATGTITATGGIFNETTNGSGQVTDSRSLSANQPVTGWVRKSTTSPLYKTSNINETISSSTGLTINVPMLSDE